MQSTATNEFTTWFIRKYERETMQDTALKGGVSTEPSPESLQQRGFTFGQKGLTF